MIDITWLVWFLIGFMAGILTCTAYMLYYGWKLHKKRAQQQTETAAKSSIEDRMKRVKEITHEQLELASAADGPQKNSLHGKSKNAAIRRMKDLDEEKTIILKSILADGHDPELTTMDEAGVISRMRLSEFMAQMGITMDPKENKSDRKIEQKGKFTVIRGGKDDGDGETVH